MRRLFHLPVLALTVWAAWLGLVTAMGWMLVRQTWAPHFLPVTVLLMMMIAAGIAVIVGGLWRTAAGPRRLRALTWLLLGVAPLCFFTSHFLYGLKAGYGRNVVLDLPLRMLATFGEAAFDGLTRVEYPVRTGGETVVMISRPMPDARGQVAAMDRHVRSLWKRLGDVSTTRRIHWIRGPVMGIDGHAVFSMCMGSRPGQMPPGPDGLSWLDRHEVAHCVLSSIAPDRSMLGTDPPSVISEGWAQANQGDDEKTVALRAWEDREQNGVLSLRELTGPTWYNRHHWPAYNQGAALVNHILRTHGPARFLELYTTCRPSTFAADCQRILGVSLDELDTAYWAEVKSLVGDRETNVVRLESLRVRPPVEPAAWNAFVTEYLAACKTLTAPYEHVDMTIERVFHSTDDKGKPVTSTHRIVVRHSGERLALRADYPHAGVAYLATPDRSFIANRRDENGRWEIVDRPHDDPASARRRAARGIRETDPVSTEAALLVAIADETKQLVDPSTFSVTQLERFTESGHSLVRVRIENTAPQPVMWRSATVVLSADDHLAPRSSDFELPDGTQLRESYTFDHEDGLPLLRSSHHEVNGPKNNARDGTMRVVERHFGPVPDSDFTEARLLGGPAIHKAPPSDDEIYKDPKTFADAYRYVLAGGVGSLVVGLICGALGGFRRQVTAMES